MDEIYYVATTYWFTEARAKSILHMSYFKGEKFADADDLDVHSRSQGYGQLELVQSLCCKVELSNSNVHDGWLGKGEDCKEIL